MVGRLSTYKNAITVKNLEEDLNKAKKAIQEFSDIIKSPNVRIMGVPEGVEREARLKENLVLGGIINENFYNMEKERENQI